MEAKSTDRKTLQLTENEQLLGELVYENLFFLKADIKLANGDLYQLKQVDFFGTSVTVTKNKTAIADLKMNWRGQIVFTFENGQEFVLKAKGFFHNKYILENKDEESLIQFDPKFNWSQFNYHYHIQYNKNP